MGQNLGRGISGPSASDSLPVDCISTIISLTSPRDACVAASVSKLFELAVKSDSVWEKFLPSEYTSLVPLYSRVFSSKQELYFTLCDEPLLIEDGKKVASVAWGDNPRFWRWISIPESRFDKIAELLNLCWINISDKMHSRYLSPRTHYSVYIVFKTKNGCPGLGFLPVNTSVGLVGQESSHKLIYFVGPLSPGPWIEPETREVMRPEAREDGWMEVELGEFYNDSCCDDISFCVDYFSQTSKSGLIIQGIEFRPTKTR